MGEYARSLAIARAARARWDIAVHFAISRDAPYAADAPFEGTSPRRAVTEFARGHGHE